MNGRTLRTREVESKLTLDDLGARSLAEVCTEIERGEHLNVYYDAVGILAETDTTFRARVRAGCPIRLTLKAPENVKREERTSIEIETDLNRVVPPRVIDVSVDLPEAMAQAQALRGILRLQRVGWVRVMRRDLVLPSGIRIEMDHGTLPNGRTFTEVEVEVADRGIRRSAVQEVMDLVPSAVPSTLSKFERFTLSLKRSS